MTALERLAENFDERRKEAEELMAATLASTHAKAAEVYMRVAVVADAWRLATYLVRKELGNTATEAPPSVHGPARQLAFGKQLRRLRETAKKSMGDLARHLGTSVTFVSDVERGKIPCPFSNEEIADFLEVPRSELARKEFGERVTQEDLENAAQHSLTGLQPPAVNELGAYSEKEDGGVGEEYGYFTRITEPPSVEAKPRRPRAFVSGERVIVGDSTGVVEYQFGPKVHVKLDAPPNLILITRTENVLPHAGEPSTVSTEDGEVQSLDDLFGRTLRNWKLIGRVP
jgi:transcriptional regulator with XRE-family HTH domain